MIYCLLVEFPKYRSSLAWTSGQVKKSVGQILELIVAFFVALARKVRIRLRPSTEFYVDYASISIYFTTFAHINHKSATTYGKD